MRVASLLLSCLVTAALLTAGADPAAAATIQVTTTADQYAGGTGSACSLREAVVAANTDQSFGGCPAGSGRDTIRVPAGTYLLSRTGAGEDAAVTGDLDLTRRVSIEGAGREKTIIDGEGTDRVLEIHGVPVRLSGVTIADGGVVDFGGGIKGTGNGSALDLLRSTVRDNIAASTGGGIEINDLRMRGSLVRGNQANIGGGLQLGFAERLDMGGSVVTENTATQSGGGISISGGDSVIVGSRIAGNTAGAGGAGIDVFGDSGEAENPATLQIVATTIESNNGDLDNDGTGDGGGIRVRSSGLPADSVVTLGRVTIAGNLAEDGDGVHVNRATLSATNTTISGNGSVASGGRGGGLWFDIGTATLRNVSFFENASSSTPQSGGHLFRLEGSVNVFNVLMGHDLAGGNCNVPVGVVPGTNVEETDPAPCGFTGAADAGLSPLADNGGSTRTHALEAGSPALGVGSDCPGLDQRGAPRRGGACDTGAYELVRCAGVVVNRVGTRGGDTIGGTPGADGILALGGRDTVRSRGGPDGVCGGPGGDLLIGQVGDDGLLGQGGNDVLKEGAGAGRLVGGPGDDACIGGPGPDTAAACERLRGIP